MLWTAAVLANNLGEVGRTWPIAEVDALTEIEAPGPAGGLEQGHRQEEG